MKNRRHLHQRRKLRGPVGVIWKGKGVLSQKKTENRAIPIVIQARTFALFELELLLVGFVVRSCL
jgi:hypothetical protein